MRLPGKKVGKYRVETTLARYELDVRLDVGASEFLIMVPKTPGEDPNKCREGATYANYESFRGPTLEEVKRQVDTFLRERDTTEFVDVIEYELDRDDFGRSDNSAGFDFRVARVSLALDRGGRPKLEVDVEVGDDGAVVVESWDGQLATPQAHGGRYELSVPYTTERWRKCRDLRDGIAELRRVVRELFGEGGEASAARLDAVARKLLPGGDHESGR